MIRPATPENETQRLASLRSHKMLDTPAEDRFDRITRTAKRMFNVPIALVSLVDEKRQWFKSKQGLAACETDRAISFCGHAILDRHPFVVEDALQDERFHDNPLVTGEPHLRFYAGVPLVDQEGYRLGTLCIIDREPRKISRDDLASLQDLAAMAQNEICFAQLGMTQLDLLDRMSEEERKGFLDGPTGMWNREGISEILKLAIGGRQGTPQPIGIMMAGVDHRDAIDELWSEEGGELLSGEVAQALRATVRSYDAIGRWGKDTFLILLFGAHAAYAQRTAERIRRSLDEHPVLQASGVTLSIGVNAFVPGGTADVTGLVRVAQAAFDAATRAVAADPAA